MRTRDVLFDPDGCVFSENFPFFMFARAFFSSRLERFLTPVPVPLFPRQTFPSLPVQIHSKALGDPPSFPHHRVSFSSSLSPA